MSGKFAKRPQMDAMLAFLRKHRKQRIVVIFDDISRLARELDAHLHLRASIAMAIGLFIHRLALTMRRRRATANCSCHTSRMRRSYEKLLKVTQRVVLQA